MEENLLHLQQLLSQSSFWISGSLRLTWSKFSWQTKGPFVHFIHCPLGSHFIQVSLHISCLLGLSFGHNDPWTTLFPLTHFNFLVFTQSLLHYNKIYHIKGYFSWLLTYRTPFFRYPSGRAAFCLVASCFCNRFVWRITFAFAYYFSTLFTVTKNVSILIPLHVTFPCLALQIFLLLC